MDWLVRGLVGVVMRLVVMLAIAMLASAAGFETDVVGDTARALDQAAVAIPFSSNRLDAQTFRQVS